MRKDMLKAQSRQRRHWRVRARVIGRPSGRA